MLKKKNQNFILKWNQIYYYNIEIKPNWNDIHKKFQIFKATATLFGDKIEMELIFIKKKIWFLTSDLIATSTVLSK